MSTTYNVITGDTFATISRKQYGTEGFASLIANANPGVMEPLFPGTTLVVPKAPNAPQDSKQSAPSGTAEEVALLIDKQRFRFWESVRIVRSVDAIDVIDFSAPFEADAPGFKDTFRPFSYKGVEVTVGGEQLFTGTMVAVNPAVTPKRKTLTVSGYGLPGVLNDCTAPASNYPIEYNNQGLKQVAEALAGPFGISVEFLEDQGAIFERVAMKPSEKVFEFLVNLAKQRNLIISSSPDGKLRFWRSKEEGDPVATLTQGSSPLLSVTPFFSPQEYYSHVTGIDPVIVGLEGSQFTVKNPRLQGVVRPITFNAPDSPDADIKAAVEAKAGRMFGNMAAYSIEVSTWRNSFGQLWQPNTILSLEAPDAMVYSPYKFVIRSIEFVRDSKAEKAKLNVVIPGAFSGKVPEVLPWDG